MNSNLKSGQVTGGDVPMHRFRMTRVSCCGSKGLCVQGGMITGAERFIASSGTEQRFRISSDCPESMNKVRYRKIDFIDCFIPLPVCSDESVSPALLPKHQSNPYDPSLSSSFKSITYTVPNATSDSQANPSLLDAQRMCRCFGAL